MSYTKGEWKARKGRGRGMNWVVESDDALIAEIIPYGAYREDDNAHLIAAAPNMYEALKEADTLICELCVRLNPQHENCTSCAERESRLKAIAKAEGKV